MIDSNPNIGDWYSFLNVAVLSASQPIISMFSFMENNMSVLNAEN